MEQRPFSRSPASFPIGLGVSLSGDASMDGSSSQREMRELGLVREDEYTHPINSKIPFSLAKRQMGDVEHNKLGKGTALVPHYVEPQAFPFRNSSSIPDFGSSIYSEKRTTFDFSPQEHASMRMDPHEHNVPEGPPGLSADSGSMTMSESSDAVLSPMPHPLGSKLNLWHNANKSGSSTPSGSAGSSRASPAVGQSAGAVRTPTAPVSAAVPQPPNFPVPTSADETLNTVQINYSGKAKRARYPSLIRTPYTVTTADWADAFNQYTWRRGENDPAEGLLQPGLPQVPTFPHKALLVDEKPCDPWGRRECSPRIAATTIAVCALFPPLWLLVGAGYFDGLVGVVPRRAKFAAFGLGGATIVAAIIIALCLALL